MKRMLILSIFATLIFSAFAQGLPHTLIIETEKNDGSHHALVGIKCQAWLVIPGVYEAPQGDMYYWNHPDGTDSLPGSSYVEETGTLLVQTAPVTNWLGGSANNYLRFWLIGDDDATPETSFDIAKSTADQTAYPSVIVFGDGGSTGYVEGVNSGTVGDEGEGTSCPNSAELTFTDNAGVYFTWTYDELGISFPFDLIITLDTSVATGIGYEPYQLAYYSGGAWVYSDPLVWTGTDPNQTTVTINSGAKDTDMVIVFSNGDDAPLPVTLDTFLVNQAQNYGEFATISWTVQSETNMSHYNVYRAETEDFNTAMHLRKVDVEEDHTTTFTYSVTDEYEIQYNTTYHYWLEGVDNAGDSEILANGTVTMEENPYVPSAVTKLEGNYPNPFNPETKIKYFVKEGETATLYIYNAKGQLVQTSSLQETSDQGNVFTWDGTSFGSGIYFYKLKTDSYSEVKKMMMLK